MSQVKTLAPAKTGSTQPLIRTANKRLSEGRHLRGNAPLIQPKLNIGAPNDKYEQEADQVAEQVMSAPQQSGAVQNQHSPPAIQRLSVSDGHTPTLSRSTAAGIQSLKGGGQPLSESSRNFFEPRFGHDFSQIRIHADNRASDLASKVSARAFTSGSNVVFGSGQYQPHNVAGQRLMAHELTHVVQQSNVRKRNLSLVQRNPMPASAAVPAAAAAPAAASVAPANGGLSNEMIRQIARRLRQAMRGWGTDEDAIYASFSGRTQPQVDAIDQTYQAMYTRSLLADLTDELTDSEMMHLAKFAPTLVIVPTRTPADMVAHQLNKAMDRLGTDEESVYAALTGRNIAERRAIKAAYLRLTGRELEADIHSEFSGSELTEALRLLNQGLLEPEDELYLAMTGAGTDETRLFRVIDGFARNKSAIITMMSAYRRKYGDLETHLRDDLNTTEYARASSGLLLMSGTISDVRYSDRRAYGYGRRNTAKLYGVRSARNLQPASGFGQVSTAYSDYPKEWENALNLTTILGSLANDCGQYAEHLIGLTGRTPDRSNMSGVIRPGISLRPTSDLQPGEAFFIQPSSGGRGEAIEEDVLSPWNNTQTTRKRLTNFHVATVVANDSRTVITSEVNAAFIRRVPWFTMYQGNSGFYRTYKREYRRDGNDPDLMRL